MAARVHHRQMILQTGRYFFQVISTRAKMTISVCRHMCHHHRCSLRSFVLVDRQAFSLILGAQINTHRCRRLVSGFSGRILLNEFMAKAYHFKLLCDMREGC